MGGVPTYYSKGYAAGQAGKKLSLRSVPYNFRLAFINGYWDGRKGLPARHQAN